ncbi:MAG: VWA domain-containing protein [Parachlamydia sp.]|jgi:Ca-activated chloride channel family protein|nr:VWA domain-containing protein [Parachlamydia sp.]
MPNFTIDTLALGVLAIFLLGAAFMRFHLALSLPRLKFSNASPLNRPSPKLKLSRLPLYLYRSALLLLSLAFIDPHFIQPEESLNTKKTVKEIPKEGSAIYLLLDRSGSMQEEAASGQTKMDLLKKMTAQFIRERTQDLMGLIAFARVPQVLAPLTLDQAALLEKLNDIHTASDPEENGTAIGYAIFKTAKLIAAARHYSQELQSHGKPTYEIKNAVMIVVTDGFQDPSRLDYGNRLRTIELDEAAAYAKSEGIHLYVINLDPRFGLADFAPHRKQMKDIAEATGGQLYLISKGDDLKQVFQTIDRLEKTPLPPQFSKAAPFEKNPRGLSLYPLLMLLGGACFATALLLESTFFRLVP